MSLKNRPASTEVSKEDCLAYAKKLHMSLVEPKALLLLQQARNNSQEEVPRSVFAHRAQQQLSLHQLKAQDTLYLLMGIEYEDYQRKTLEFGVEESAEYGTIVGESKEAIRAIINAQGPAQPAASPGRVPVADKKND